MAPNEQTISFTFDLKLIVTSLCVLLQMNFIVLLKIIDQHQDLLEESCHTGKESCFEKKHAASENFFHR